MLAFASLCLFVLDVSITGGGHYCMVGPISLRMLLAGVCFVLSMPLLIQRVRSLVTKPLILMFIAFIIYLIVCAVRGLLGNGRMNVLISDLKGFTWLFLMPLVIVLVTDRNRFESLLTVIVIGGVIQATVVFLTNLLCCFILENSTLLESYFIQNQIGTVDRITNGFFRIFMNSSPYMTIACAIALIRQVQAGRPLLRYVLSIAWMSCAILVSFTRSLYGCNLIVMLCVSIGTFLFFHTGWKKHIKLLVITAAATGCLFFAAEFTFNANYFNFAIARTFGTEIHNSLAMDLRSTLEEWLTPESDNATQVPNAAPQVDTLSKAADNTILRNTSTPSGMDPQKEYLNMTQASDALRKQTQQELLTLIAQNPVFGHGLGAYAPVRDTGSQPDTDGLDEFFYLDMLARTGVVGLLLYIAPFGYIVYCFLKARKQIQLMPGALAMLCGMVGFWAITWFNPWMNAVLGITAYALCCTIPQLLQEKTSESVNTTQLF